MLLHAALLQSECPICLQPLNFTVQPPPSLPGSPTALLQNDSRRSSNGHGTANNSSSSSSSPHSPTVLPPHPQREGEPHAEFRITFAPGVYGSDAADPWHASFELPQHGSGPTPSGATDADLNPLSPSTPASYHTTDESASGVAVLPCGHLLHNLCAMQLCEYAAHPSCPVCRTKLVSAADLILFRPRVRAPSRVAFGTAAAAAAAPSARGSVLSHHKTRGTESGGASRSGAVAPPSVMAAREQHEAVSEGSSSVTVVGDETETPLFGVWDRDEQADAPLLPDISESRGAVAAVTAATAVPLDRVIDTSITTPSPSQSLPESAARVAEKGEQRGTPSLTSLSGSSTEDEILILGARQLPPAQAYAELLLRSTASWSDRTDVLKTRVTHLKSSQQQLQRDCEELEATLNTARRRREVLLNVPAGHGEQHGDGPESTASSCAAASFDRLRELRRLCDETRTAMAAATAELAASARAGAEVRRQIDKYTRKLARLDAGDGTEEPEEKRGKAEHVTSGLSHT